MELLKVLISHGKGSHLNENQDLNDGSKDGTSPPNATPPNPVLQ
jgi:hypothetical protein